MRLSPLNREIIAIALPSIAANITTPLLGLVDTAVSGHLGGEAPVAAIAVGSSMFNLLYWLFAFLRMGASGLTARATGRGDRLAQALTLYRGIAVAVTVAMAMLLLQLPIVDGLLWILSPQGDVAEMARDYFLTVVWGAPAVLVTYAVTGWFIGMQSSGRPLAVSIVINVINITVSPLLAFSFELGLQGVAVGTLSAQWAGCLVAMYMARRYGMPVPRWSALFDRGGMAGFMKVNTDIMLRTVCLIAVTMWFTREGARQGDVVLAVNSLLMQLFVLFSYMADGFANAGEAVAGRLSGAGDVKALRRCVKLLFKWSGGMALLYTAAYFVGGESFLSLLTDDDTLCSAASEYLPWAISIPLAGFVAFAWDGIYIGLTATRQMLASMAVAAASFFVIYFSFNGLMGNHALWMAFLVYLAVRGLTQSFLWPKILDEV